MPSTKNVIRPIKGPTKSQRIKAKLQWEGAYHNLIKLITTRRYIKELEAKLRDREDINLYAFYLNLDIRSKKKIKVQNILKFRLNFTL